MKPGGEMTSPPGFIWRRQNTSRALCGNVHPSAIRKRPRVFLEQINFEIVPISKLAFRGKRGFPLMLAGYAFPPGNERSSMTA